MDLAYCPKCRQAVQFDTKRRTIVTEYEGRRYSYAASQAICRQCGEVATYPSYQEEAGIAFNNALRETEGLVSLSVVCEIPKRYAIGKRPLSRILGLGEHTYSQLMNGQTPSAAHSALIERIYDDPMYYLSLLEARKDMVRPSTYANSKRATDAFVRRDYPDAYRIYELGRTFVFKAQGDITKVALQKLVYYTQGFTKALLGESCFGQMPRAYAMGPVYGQLWHEYNDSVSSYFAYDEGEEYSSPFTAAEEEVIDAVYRCFGCYSGSALSQMTHSELPWRAARARWESSDGSNSSDVMREEDMDSFFGGLVEEYAMSGPDDIARYARNAFQMVSGDRS